MRRMPRLAAAVLVALEIAAGCRCASAGDPPANAGGAAKPSPNLQVRPLPLRGATIPRAALAGGPVEILYSGALPNPGWSFLRCERNRKPGVPPRTWLLSPMIVYSLSPGTNVIQVEVPYEGRERVVAFADTGEMTVEVEGSSPEESVRGEVLVLPKGTMLFLEVTGGFAGVEERYVLGRDGSLSASRRGSPARATTLAPDPLRSLLELRTAARLDSLPPLSTTDQAADLFFYDLTDFGDGTDADGLPIRVRADDLSAPPSLAPLLQSIRERGSTLLAPPGPTEN